MKKQEYIDFLKAHGATITHGDCDTIATFANYEIMLSCVPTDDNDKVIENFDFTPFATDEKPCAYLSQIKVGDSWKFVDELIGEMPLIYKFDE